MPRGGNHLARIAGINIPLNKRVEVGLTYVFGVGRSRAQEVLKEAGVDPNTYVKDLTDDEIVKLRSIIDNDLTVEGDLRRERSQNVKRLMEIGAYRGLRHRRGLPVDGQRTKTNARTRKGPKRMQVAGKKKVKK
jgi:small subunit ribosomal protein S13